MADEKIAVRAATEADVPFLAAAEKACFSDAWSENAIASHFSTSYTCAFLLLYDDTPAGYLLGTCFPPESELYRVAVLPEYRRSGGGAALLSAFLAYARRAGAETSYLEVRAGNLPAVALYRRFGYREVGVRKNYYRFPTEDARNFLCTLSEDGRTLC